jgi:phosphatidylinositol kinase/protein kinase (PI-3  family)
MWFKLLKVCTTDRAHGYNESPITSGFFRSISLRNKDALQDTLRLLTLWFKYGAHENISHAMAAGFSTVEVDTWLDVIPQVCSVN